MKTQQQHPDAITNPTDTEYFFIGSGKIQAAIQWSKNPECTPLGLILSMPHQFSRKNGSYLFHPELGLSRTMITVVIDGVRYQARHDDLTVCWSDYEGVPNVLATWHANGCEIMQSFHSSPDSHALIEWVGIFGAGDRKVEIETALYANPNLFSAFGSTDKVLYDTGYNSIYLSALQKAGTNERYLTVESESFEGGKEVHLVYVAGKQNERVELQPAFTAEREYWQKTSSLIAENNPKLVSLFNAAKFGLRAVVSSTGRFDSGVWQYGMEWGRDAAMVAEGLIYSGQFELAKSVLLNILTRLSNAKGMVAEASRFRGGIESELDSNGEVLSAMLTYVEWTGDRRIVSENWQRISAIADFLLLPEFLDDATGMLKASREMWERNQAMGIKFGYDVSHQTFGIVGLEAAAKLAKIFGDTEKQSLWFSTATKMRSSFHSHPTQSMIESGRIIKRRLIDGSIQRELEIDYTKENYNFYSRFTPDGLPLAQRGVHKLQPDIVQCLPILYGIVDRTSEIAIATMLQIENLWSQAWEGDGYGRYDISGEPDSPGPWPLATGIVAEAYFEMGMNNEGMKALDWLIERGGEGGSFFEFYGDRPTPPLPPIGVLPWVWAQIIALIVKGILGARIENGELTFSSKLPELDAKLRFQNQ